LLAILALLMACGDAAPYTGRRARAAQVAAPRVSRPAAPPVAAVDPADEADNPYDGVEFPPPPPVQSGVGALERPLALRHFFEALARLDDGRAHDDVRIVQFGDSHTAADYETGPLRRALQARFGDGGRGFVQIGRPWKWYVQEGLHAVGNSGWAMERGKFVRGTFTGDGMYGLSGVSIEASAKAARAWTEVTARASRVELSFLEQPSGGSVDLVIDGTRAARVTTRGKTVSSAFRAFDVTDEPHQIQIEAVGDGAVRIFGMALDRAQAGVVFDALGINGARIANFLTWSEPHMSEQLRHRAPDLVALAYGTNEAGDDTPIAVYERQLVDAIGRIERAVPSASCILLGPPDRAIREDGVWTTIPRLLDIVAAQRRVAAAAGCAYYSQLDAMGGPGTIATWALEPQPRAMLDRVHLSREGYAQLGNQIAADLVHAYGAWRADNGLPPVQPQRTPIPPAPGVPADPHEPIAKGLAGR
jgi:lysophospholipase L1-like esterase